MSVLNQQIPRIESMEKATGAIPYTGDLSLPNLAYAAVVRSTHSAARVTGIDLSRAAQVPGYLGCLLPSEVPNTFYNPSGNPPSALLLKDQYILTDHPKCIGDRILLVAAETEEACRKAADAVRVYYKVEKPLMTLKAAMDPGAAPIQPHLSDTNVVMERNVRQGSREEGRAKSEVLLSGHFTTPPMQHVPLETTCCLVDYSNGKELLIYSNSQTIFQERRILAELLGLKETDIRMIKPAMGGGFGSRQQLHAQPAAALLSRKLRRPIRILYTREEELTASAVRLASETEMELGADRTGKLQYYSIRCLANIGPYTIHGPTIVAAASRKVQYNIPNYFFDGYSVLTNGVSGGAFRGYGNTQVTFGREILLDRMARKLGLDPIDFRLANHVSVGECFPGSNIPVTSCAIEACAQRARELQEEIDAREGLRQDAECRQSWGVAFATHGSGPSSREGLSSALVLVNDDGTVRLLVGSADIGQGSNTMLCILAAETLKIPLPRIQIRAADTLLTPYDTGTFASSQTFVCGNAVVAACQDAKARLSVFLQQACVGQTVREESDGSYTIEGTDGVRHMTFEEAVRFVSFHSSGGVIIGSASYKAQASPNPFAVCMAKAEYYPAINAIRLLHVIEVADVGTPVNRLTVEGQLEGGIAQGVGYALCERMEYNPRTQKTLSATLLHYRIPEAGDMPSLHVDLVDSYEPTGPHGAKSIGELSTVPVAPAIVNAVVRASGTELSDLPLCTRFLILPNSAPFPGGDLHAD